VGAVPLYFFFQAEDGIRDFHVTGVQTCALPISNAHATYQNPATTDSTHDAPPHRHQRLRLQGMEGQLLPGRPVRQSVSVLLRRRSEERRVGKEGRSRWSAAQEKETTRAGRARTR